MLHRQPIQGLETRAVEADVAVATTPMSRMFSCSKAIAGRNMTARQIVRVAAKIPAYEDDGDYVLATNSWQQ